MKTRTEEEMLALITGFAEADDRIRAVLMNGSRVDPNAARDPFQDYDIVNLVTDVEPFKDKGYVIPHFGETIVVEQPEAGPWPEGDADGSYNYNMQLADGNRIDLDFVPLGAIEDYLKDSLTKVLLDKDGIVPELPAPDERSYFIKRPTQDLYEGCCHGFFFTLGSHIPKTIWRRKLPLLKFFIEACLREPLVMMLAWEVGIRRGFEQSIGRNGKHLQSCLTPEVWSQYEKTYVGSDYDDLWESLFLFHRLFKRSADFVAEQGGFRFPQEEAAKVLVFLEDVRRLSSDADRIY